MLILGRAGSAGSERAASRRDTTTHNTTCPTMATFSATSPGRVLVAAFVALVCAASTSSLAQSKFLIYLVL